MQFVLPRECLHETKIMAETDKATVITCTTDVWRIGHLMTPSSNDVCLDPFIEKGYLC